MSRATQDTTISYQHTVPDCHRLWSLFPKRSSASQLELCGPTTPIRPEPDWFGLFPVRSPLLGESLLFSLPAGTKMVQFPALTSCTYVFSTGYVGMTRRGLPHSEISGL